jgi:predicted ATPase/DNA-binding SARP family transcriptional activator
MAGTTSRGCDLEIRLFGRAGIYADGALQNLKLPAKSFELLCLLALRAGQPLDRAKVAFTLWPDDSEEDAKAKLRRHLYLLGRAVAGFGGESQVVATTTTLTWLQDGTAQIDIVEFMRLTSLDALERAAALYTGDLLADLHADWIEAPRERLRKQQMQNLLSLSSRHLHTDPTHALKYAETALGIDRWDEEAVREVIYARTRLGDRAGAARTYREFGDRLQREFGCEPAAETKHALETATIAEPHNNNLPRQLTSFVGREQVEMQIVELIREFRLVTLVGAGGVGKTRCAVEVGVKMLDNFGDGVWLTELAPIADQSVVVHVVGRALSVQEVPGRPFLDAVLAFLKRKQLLLILDNCEHVIEETQAIANAILRSCPSVRILATSRETLNIAGENVFRMPSLAVPSEGKALTPQETLHFGAPLLFTDRALSIDSRFALTEENLSPVVEICRRLDGIPLAIELAAARVKVLSPRDIVQRLDERFRVLTGGDRSALPRHQTMRALIDWSYDLLADEERGLFRKLSIFAGGFTLESACAVCSADTSDEIAMLDLLARLVDKSLVQSEPNTNGTRYRLLESTRQYARERMTERGEYEGVARAHATAFLILGEELYRSYDTMPDRAWAARAEPETENWRAALGWALTRRGDLVLGQKLAGTVPPMWFVFGPVEARNWVHSAVEMIDEQTSDAVIAALELAEAQLDAWHSLQKASYDAAMRALARYRTLEDARGVVQAQRRAGRALIFLGRVAEGEMHLREALAASEALGLQKLRGWVLEGLAWARQEDGDIDAARAYFTEALAIARATESERMEAVIAVNLAEAEFRSGDAAAALKLAREARDVVHDDRMIVGSAPNNMAAYLVSLERYDEARLYAREGLQWAIELEFEVTVAFALQHLAAVAALRTTGNAEQRQHDGRIRAARLLGYVDARLGALEALREHTEQQQYEKVLAALRTALTDHEVEKLLLEGRTWSGDQAVAEAELV